MATMQCPECGREYALSATRCTVDDAELIETLAGDQPVGEEPPEVDDDVASVDETDGAEDDDDDEADDPEREQVAYELSEWSSQDRVLLEQLLAGADVARAWEGTDLVVRAADEEVVDELVEQVRATDQPVLDPEADKLVFEVNDWSSEQLVALTDGLGDQGIAYEFDVEGDLVVLASAEDAVEALLDGIEFGPTESAARTMATPTTPTTASRPPPSSRTCSWPAIGSRRAPPTTKGCWAWCRRPSASTAGPCRSATCRRCGRTSRPGPAACATSSTRTTARTRRSRTRPASCGPCCASTSDAPVRLMREYV